MNKHIILSAIASTMLIAGGDIKPVEPVVEVVQPVEVAVEEESFGTVSGQLRAFYIDRTYLEPSYNNRNSLAFGGWIGYDTAAWNGLSAGVKFYAIEGAKIHTDPYSSANYDPSLYGDGFDEYGFIGEAYLNYKMGNTNLKVGRQKLNTPLAGADDARMLPSLFEAAVLSNSDIEDTTLVLAHVTKETVGTFGNAYGNSLSYFALQSGYGLGYKEGTNGKFADMGVIALGEGTDTDGVTAGAVVYKGIEGMNLQVWNYYAHDILNALYLSADYGFNVSDSVKIKASAQYIGQSDVGDAVAGDVDSDYWAAKLGTTIGALSAYVAYSQTGDSDGALNGGIISPWGGMPAYTQGMVTRHQFFADTNTWKVAATYKLADNLSASAYYASFDVGEGAADVDNGPEVYVVAGIESKEAGFDIKYQATKNLNLRFRGNFPTDHLTVASTGEGLDWSEYRLIANYSF